MLVEVVEVVVLVEVVDVEVAVLHYVLPFLRRYAVLLLHLVPVYFREHVERAERQDFSIRHRIVYVALFHPVYRKTYGQMIDYFALPVNGGKPVANFANEAFS